ncbi:LysM peptidoglycan-binding domain-containing protein [Roseateles chitinivorans]|uniref:LysM peptidoglycan-binding domain-containing protein n=1 Tax=Roseateles chitinivorans TaxID=2917965 RepID=UPI003D668039
MVAIVAGNGLGLSLGSLGGLGARGSFGDAALGRAGALAYVNASTGNLILQNQDELLAGHGLSASSLRTYNSQGQLNDDNGDNWTLGLYARQIQLFGTVNTAGSTIQRIGRDGAVQVFSFNTGTGTYLSTAGAGAHDVIEYVAGTGELVWTEGSTRLRERYDAQGRLVATNDAAGNSLQYTYGSNGLVSSVSHGSGTQRTFYDYNGTLLTQIRTVGQDGLSETRVRYGYDASNRLSTVTVDLTPQDGSIADGKVYQTTYTYDGASTRVASVAQSDGTSLAITYKLVGSDYRVETLTDALGAVTRFAYDTANRRTTVTDARLQNTVYSYDAQGQLLQVDAPAVNGTIASTSFQYNGNGDVTRVTDGEGRWVATEYDGWGNATKQTDSAGNVVIRAYNGSQQLVAESIAGDGSTSSASTRFVYAQANPTQLRFQISPEGRVIEYRYNGFGERNAAIQYAAGAYAVAGLAYDAVPNEATMSSWAAARDLTRTQRQDFEYDGLGQLNKSIEYGKVDAQGVGIADDTRSITQYVYDRHGKLLSTINPRNGTTGYTYDGLGRVRTTTDAAQRLTTTIYDDANRKIQVSAFNGLITTSSYDRAGRLVSVLEGSAQTTNLGETTYAYDARNQLLMSRDATGNRHWYVYDTAGRRVGDVDALGTLTEYRFDRNGQVTSTLRYGTLINTAVLVDGSGNPLTVSIDALRPAATAKDQRSWRVYDEVNRLVKEVSALGEVVEYTYDRSSRVVMTRRYATLIDVSALGDKPAASAIAPAQNAGDGWTRTFYDADGRVAATLDAVGTMVESQYDDAGRLVTTVRRANRVTAANPATGTLAQLRPQAADGDATTRYFYDAQGRLVATLDALNYLTEKGYDANDNVVRELRYSTKSPAATSASSIASLRSGAVLQESGWSYDAVDRVLTQTTDPAGLKLTTSYQYDDANRRLDVTDPAGTVTRTVYDVQGNARSVTVDQGRLGLTTASTYDAQGRVLTSTDAAGTVTQYGYDALGRKVSQRVDPAGLNITTLYAYDVQGNLARVTDPNGKQTRYIYDAQGRLKYTLDAEYGLSENVYDGLGRVAETVLYTTRQTGIQTYDAGQGLISNGFASIARDLVLDARTQYKYDSAGRKIAEIDAAGGVKEFVYDALGRVIKTIDYGTSTKNLLKNADFKDGTSGGYGIWSQDAANVAWGNRYNDDWAVPGQGTLWLRQTGNSQDPAVLTQHTTPAIPGQRYYLSVLTAVHRASAYLHVYFVDANGNYVGEGPLTGGDSAMGYEEKTGGRLLSNYKDLNGYFTAPTNAAFIRVDVVKNPTAPGWSDSYLFVAGMSLQLANPNATDVQGWRPATTSSDRVTQFKYDAAGRMVGQIDNAGAVTSYTYDAAGRVIETTQYATSSKNLLTNPDFKDGTSGGYGMWTLDTGGVAWGNRLNADWSVPGQGTLWLSQTAGSQNPAVLTQHTTPAVPGQRYYLSVLAATHGASAYLHVYFVDANGNYVAEGPLSDGDWAMGVEERTGGPLLSNYKDLNGYFTAPAGAAFIRIDVVKNPTASGNQTSHLFVANMSLRMADAASTDPDRWRPPASASDRKTRFKYDAAGRKVAEIDPSGSVTEFIYDNAGRVARTIGYATAVSPSAASDPVNWRPSQAASDRQFHFKYDTAGRKVAEIDATGSVMESVLDAAGQVIRTAQYATRVTSQAATSTSALDWRPALSSSDRITRFKYDAVGRKVADIDAAGSVTEYVYDAAGRVVQSIHYANSAQNLLKNADFKDGTSGGYGIWSQDAANVAWGNRYNDDWAVPGQGTLWLRQMGNSQDPAVLTQHTTPAIPGQRYYLSVLTAVHRTSAYLHVYFVDANGNYVGEGPLTGGDSAMGYEEKTGGRLLSNYKDLNGYFTAPTNAAFIRIDVVKNPTAPGWSDSYLFVAGMSLRTANPDAPDAANWRPTVSSADRITRVKYDAVGRKIADIDAEGGVVEYVLDTSGRVIRTTQYATSSKNLLTNPDFKDGTSGGYGVWTLDTGGVAWGNRLNADWSVPGQGTLWLSQTAGSQNPAVLTQHTTPAVPGQRYYLSVLAATHGASAYLHVYFVDANGNYVAEGPLSDGDWAMGVEERTGGPLLSNYKDLNGYFTAPAGAAFIRIDVVKNPTAPGNQMSHLFVAKMSLQVANSQSNDPGRWRPRASASDRVTRYVYDAAGLPVYTIDASGGVTRQRFNVEGELIESVRYGRRYDGVAELPSLDAFYANVANRTVMDRATRTVLDAAGRPRFSIDALGGVVETVYDDLGRVARTIAYDSPIDLSAVTDVVTPVGVRAMLPASTLNTRETVYAYDADGLLRFTATSQRTEQGWKYFNVTEQRRDEFGQVVGTTSYADPIVLQDLLAVVTGAQIESRLARDASRDRARQMSYDAAGRVKSSTDGEGFTESYEYDALGNKTRHTNQAGSVFDYAYDAAGRLIQETSPQVNLAKPNGLPEPGVVTTRMSYNAFGQLASRTEASGRPEQRTTRYEYDALGRQTIVRYEAIGVYDAGAENSATNGANGTVSRTETLTETYSQTVYDVFGQAVINRDVGGVLSYKTYDQLGRLINEVDGNHEVTAHYYSAIAGEYSGFTRLGARAVFSDSLGASAAAIDAAVAAMGKVGSRSSSTYFDRLGRIVANYERPTRNDLSGDAFRYDPAVSAQGNWAEQTEYAYNAFGEVISRNQLLDRLVGRVARSRYVYDQQGRAIREVNAEGYVTDHRFNAFGEETQVVQYARAIDPEGDVLAQPVASTAAAGGDPAGGYDRVTVFAYDRRGAKTSETQQGTQIGVRWGDRSLARQVVDVVTTFTNDQLGRQTRSSKVVVSNGAQVGFAETTSTFFDALGRTTGTIDEAGRAVAYDRDAYGNALRIRRLGTRTTDGTMPAVTSANDQTTLQSYDKLSRLVWTREATGAETFYSRDARGQVVKQWQPFLEWSSQDSPPSMWTPLNVSRNAVQFFSYDKAGRQIRTLTSTQRAAGQTLTFTAEDVVYNSFGEITSRLRDGVLTEQNAYDVGGRLWKSSVKGVTTIYWYNLQGLVTSSFTSDSANLGAVADPAAAASASGVRRTTTEYDRLGRAVRQVGPTVSHDEGRGTTQLATLQTLDAWGNVLSVTRNGVLRQTYRYDAGNHAIATYTHNVTSVNANGVSSSAAILSQAFFDASGRQVGAIDGNGSYTSWVFNNAGLLDTVYRGDRTMESYWYDGLGRMMNRYDALGRQYTYSYDKADREISRMVFVPGARTYQLAQVRYDELGRKISETSGEETSIAGQLTLYWYDGRGNLTMSAKPQGQRTSYSYDAAGNKISETDANGFTATWSYSAAGQLTSHTDIGGAVYSYGYDFAGALKTQTNTATRGQNLAYEYTESGLLRQITDNYRGSSTRYDYDAEGNRTRETFKEGGLVYRDVTSTYDTQGRLATAQDASGPSGGQAYSFSVSYDAVGNRRRVQGTQGYRSFNSDTGVQDVTPRAFDQWFTYDEMNRVVINEGVLTNGVISDVGAKNVFYYDGEGRRRQSLTKTGGTSPGGTRLDYEFDFADRLTKESTRKLTYANGAYTAGDAVVKHKIDYSSGTQVDYAWDTLFSGEQFKLTTSTTTFDANGRALTRKDFVEGIASSQTTATTPQSWAEQTLSYDKVGNLMRVNATAYAFKGTTGGTTQVRATYKNSVTTTDYSYYLQEGYLERGQALSGQVWGENSSTPTNMTPSQSIQSYDANGNLLQLQRGTSYRWYVTDNSGHIVTTWATNSSTLSGSNQDGVMRVWTPISGAVTGTAGAFAAMPATPTVSLTKDLYREKQLYLNDRRVGMIQESRRNIAGKGGRDPYRIETSAVDMDVSGLRYDTSLKEGSTVTYTVQAGETLQSLALRFYGDDALWYRIAEANTLDDSTVELKPGQSINIPQVTRSLNSSSSGAVYNADKLIGDTSAPVVMPPPPPAKGGCGAVGMFIVIVVAVVVTALTYNYLAGEGILSMLGAGAAAGAAGSAAGQLTGMALGMQSGFSWKQVGIGAIGGAVSAGIGPAAGMAPMEMAWRAALSNALTQGIGVVTGLQDSFSWRSVAIAAVAAPVADQVGKAFGTAASSMQLSTEATRIGQALVRGLRPKRCVWR